MRTALIIIVLTLCAAARGQYYSTGADPLRMHWLRMEGDGAWSVDVDSAAWRWAWAAHGVIGRQAGVMASDFPQIDLVRRDVDVVVHSRHAYSNGLVTWAPRRLEAYAYNRGDDDCVAWTTHLLTHEYRHVLQTQSTITGFSRFVYGMLGEQSTGVVLGLFVPKWYLEGDAVWAETQYTAGGRGRNSLFLQQMRALATSGRTPSFSQAYFGSYARRVPDYYSMGYLMVSAASDTLGNGLFGRAARRSGRLPFTFFPFQRSLRQQTSMRPMALYDWALSRWAERWAQEQTTRQDPEHKDIIHPRGVKCGYRESLCTTPWADGYVCYATSPDFISRFEVYDRDGRLMRTITPSQRDEERFAVKGDTLIWSEMRQHCRWANASENCLMMANLSTGSTRRLTRGGSYHSPAISPRGEMACVEIGDDMLHRVCLGTENDRGEVTFSSIMVLPQGWQVPEVAWIDNERLALMMVSDEGRLIAELDTRSGTLRTLMGPRHKMVRNMSVDRTTGGGVARILFAMDSDDYYSEIYSLTLAGGEAVIRREATAKNGINWPTTESGRIIASLYGSGGYTPAMIETAEGAKVERIEPRPVTIGPDSLGAAERALFGRMGAMRVHVRPNVHSWGPVVVDADAQTIAPGVSIASQNTHGTVTYQAGYNFAPSDDDDRLFLNVTWDWLWPRFILEAKWGHTDYDFTTAYTLKEKQQDGTERSFDIKMRADDRTHLARIKFQTSLPLTHNSGPWLRALTPYVNIEWQRESSFTYDVTQTETTASPNRVISYKMPSSDLKYACLTPGLSAHIIRRAAANDFGYRLGISAQVLYDKSLSRDNYGEQLFGQLRLYLPGFARRHQITLTAQGQTKMPGAAIETVNGYKYHLMMSNRVAAPYGLSKLPNKWSVLMRAAYGLPLLDPDWQWGPVAYIKRINFRAIGDLGINRPWTGAQTAGLSHRWTASGELWAETRLATLPFPISIGCRATYRPETKDVWTALLLSVTFQ